MSKNKHIRGWIGSGALIAVAGVIAVGAGIAAVVFESASTAPVRVTQMSSMAQPLRTDWEQSHRHELLHMKSRADALAIQGNPREAYILYEQCVATVGAQRLTDPVLVNAITSAQENQDRLLEVLINSTATASTPTESSPAIATSSSEAIAAQDLPTNTAQFAAPVPQPVESNNATSGASRSPVTPVASADPSEKLFSRPSTPTPNRTSRFGSGSTLSPDTNLDPIAQGPSIFQPFTGSDLRPTVIASPKPPANNTGVGSTVACGSGPQNVWVMLGVNDVGKTVTGTVDGHPYTIGGPNDPTYVEFTGLPAGSVPVVVDGQHYNFNGKNIYFSLPSQISVSPSAPAATPTAVQPPQDPSSKHSGRGGAAPSARPKGGRTETAMGGS